MKTTTGGKESRDLNQKNLEAFPDVAADILNAFLYNGKQAVQAERLYPAPTETTYAAPGAALRNQLEDVSKYEVQEGSIRTQYLLANQSEEDGGMVLRKAGYVGAVYREQYDGKVKDRFPVVSLVLYWGSGRWRKARSIRELFDQEDHSPQLWEMADDCRLHVFEMRNLPPETRERFRSDMRIVVDYLAEGNSFRSDQLVVHKEALVRLLRALGGDRDVEDTVLMLEEMNIKEEDEITMCELFDQYTRRGRAEGRAEGKEEGRITLIGRMLSNGMERSAILKYTDCTEEELDAAAALNCPA